jgi:hypothetical protein
MKSAEMVSTAVLQGEETAHAGPQERAGSMKGQTKRTGLIKRAVYSIGTILILDFGLLDSAISASFSLDTGKLSFP